MSEKQGTSGNTPPTGSGEDWQKLRNAKHVKPEQAEAIKAEHEAKSETEAQKDEN
ncbi:MAG: hypothetical protein HUJ63_01485, partial [Enterococcus sp.]|nr:hypothetical protein [Enterococcus sp.]